MLSKLVFPCLLTLFATPAYLHAVCLPGPCRVVQIKVIGCEDLGAKLKKDVGSFNQRQDKPFLKISGRNLNRMIGKSGAFIEGRIIRSREIPYEECNAQSKQVEEGEWVVNKHPETRPYIYQDVTAAAACQEFKKEKHITALMQNSCCDTIPASEVECFYKLESYLTALPENLQLEKKLTLPEDAF